MASDDSIRSVMGYRKENVLVKPTLLDNFPQVTMAPFVPVKCKRKKFLSNDLIGGNTRGGKKVRRNTKRALLKNI